jgi:DNA sulfur modification protein DndB
MGNTNYFLTTARFGEVARIVNYKEDDKNWPVALRQQRPLNMSRIRNDMVPYLIEMDDHFYNALVVEHVRPGSPTHDIKFVPDAEDPTTGWVELEGIETLEALDGQHRLKSIELAVAENPDLASESIGLVIVPHKTVSESQQLFSDLNRTAKPTPKSLNIMFEHREEEALLAKKLVESSKYLAGRVNLTGSALSKRSPYIVTIATLYEAVKVVKPILTEVDDDARVAQLTEYWDTVLASLPDMTKLVSGQIHPGDLRAKYVYATGLGFEALAEAIKSAVVNFPSKWSEILSEGLSRIRWDLTDSQWEGVALFAGRVAIARAARRRTATLVKHLLGLPNEESHIKDLEEAYRTLNRKIPSPLLVPEAV